MVLPMFVLLVPMMLMVLMPMAMLAGFFVMMVMVFVYHSFRLFSLQRYGLPLATGLQYSRGLANFRNLNVKRNA